jgi:formate dehydrogenase iron-sulfur subunit
MPGGEVPTYYPSLVEWLVSLGLIAAAVFFFGAGAKLLPILPKLEPAEAGAGGVEGSGKADAATHG